MIQKKIQANTKKDTSQYKKKEQLKKGTGYRIEKYS